MKKQLEKLVDEKNQLRERINLIDNVIHAFQEVCLHVDENDDTAFEVEGNDSHKTYYVCNICGKERSV